MNHQTIGTLSLAALSAYVLYEAYNKKHAVNDPSLLVIYGTEGGKSKKLAEEFCKSLKSRTKIICISEYEVEDLFTEKRDVVFFLSTYSGGKASKDAEWFSKWLQETRFDPRVGLGTLSLRFAVFGLGDSAYKEFCTWPKLVDKLLHELGAKRLSKVHCGDIQNDFRELESFEKHLASGLAGIEYEDDEEESYSEEDEEKDLMDIEDIGKEMSKSKSKEIREMVTPKLRQSLEKQKYKIVGTHSGVKLCRWTKSMLRGRGGCYKHSFYGIASHQCMEATPSLACANKCVFCWRSHTNPVGTEWKWKTDPPREIVEGAMSGHYQMIKSLKGVPGVKEERYQEGFNIQHCALSLVGEPIMYPRINELLDILHEKRISSFLVTNAQFPEEIRNLVPVTQLYVSIDSGTKEGLKAIDRPLFPDFWERYLDCLDELAKRNQRTVYRLTLVKDFNTEEIPHYADLVRRGNPEFVEVKGVTFCGFSGSQPLTMKNVPYHIEVVQFCERIIEKINDDYEIACVHEHSCSVLIAKKKFKIDGKWHTWINYQKFHDLVAAGQPFTSMDYIAETPSWAVWNSEEQGFDPAETRIKRLSKAEKANLKQSTQEVDR